MKACTVRDSRLFQVKHKSSGRAAQRKNLSSPLDFPAAQK